MSIYELDYNDCELVNQPEHDNLQQILDTVKAKRSSDGWQGRCPAHNDGSPSLSIKQFDSGVVSVKCFAGCGAKELAKALNLDCPWKEGDECLVIPPAASHDKPPEKPLTLKELAHYVFPDHAEPEWLLTQWGVKDYTYQDKDGQVKGGVSIPYCQWNGDYGRHRLRLSLKGKDKFRWGKSPLPIVPYGLTKARDYKRDKLDKKLPIQPLWIVEGETDCWRLWQACYPAIGLPGAKMTDKLDAKYLSGFPGCYIWQEPDSAGSKFAHDALKRIEGFNLTDFAIKIICQRKYKDPCEWLQKSKSHDLSSLGNCIVSPEEYRAVPKDCTQFHVSQSFVKDYSRGEFVFNDKLGGWLRWDGCRFVEGGEHGVYVKMTEYLEHLQAQGEEIKDEEQRKYYLQFVHSQQKTKAVEDCVRGCRASLHASEADLDADPLAVNLRNGWIDLRTMEFRPHDRPMPFTQVAGCNYDPNATCPVWVKCVNDYWQDEAVQRHFQQQCGIVLSGEPLKQMLYFYGTGDNGKTLIFESLTALLGSYATALPIDALLHKQFSGSSCDIAKLRGARLVTTSELPDGARLNEGLIKQITGGGTITASMKYRNPIDFRPQFKLWFDGNFTPNISTDEAVWSRFNYLHFTKKFDKDNSLLGKLKTELSGVLNWCLRGWLDYMENGLFMPESMTQAKGDFKKESNEFLTFLETFFTRSAEERVSRADAYGVFKLWWEANHPGYGYRPGSQKFTREMRNLGLGETKYAGERYWTGIQANPVFKQTMDGEFIPQG
jgi:P4 family phage/plasmid primase-like protien